VDHGRHVAANSNAHLKSMSLFGPLSQSQSVAAMIPWCQEYSQTQTKQSTTYRFIDSRQCLNVHRTSSSFPWTQLHSSCRCVLQLQQRDGICFTLLELAADGCLGGAASCHCAVSHCRRSVQPASLQVRGSNLFLVRISRSAVASTTCTSASTGAACGVELLLFEI